MGSQTKKVLDYACANKFCRVCESAKSKGKEPVSHDCRLNHSGSSKSMEASVGVKLFQQAPTHGVNTQCLLGMTIAPQLQKLDKRWGTVYRSGLTQVMQREQWSVT